MPRPADCAGTAGTDGLSINNVFVFNGVWFSNLHRSIPSLRLCAISGGSTPLVEPPPSGRPQSPQVRYAGSFGPRVVHTESGPVKQEPLADWRETIQREKSLTPGNGCSIEWRVSPKKYHMGEAFQVISRVFDKSLQRKLVSQKIGPALFFGSPGKMQFETEYYWYQDLLANCNC